VAILGAEGVAVVYLTTLFSNSRLYSVEWKGDTWVMNWKVCGSKKCKRGYGGDYRTTWVKLSATPSFRWISKRSVAGISVTRKWVFLKFPGWLMNYIHYSLLRRDTAFTLKMETAISSRNLVPPTWLHGDETPKVTHKFIYFWLI
jgi:hypothetical protein